jgi:hypothetical protein
MSLKHIRTAIDPEQFMKGDVVIVKRTYVNVLGNGKHETRCTHCSKFFPTTYRRMGRYGTARACEVRNVPQCSKCRGRYRKPRYSPSDVYGSSPGLDALRDAAALKRLFTRTLPAHGAQS